MASYTILSWILTMQAPFLALQQKLIKTEAFSLKNDLGLKIFHGVEITAAKLAALSSAFGIDLQWPKTLEMDVVAVSEEQMWLLEVKSSVGRFEKAMAQLNEARRFFAELLKSLGCGSGCGIKKIFASQQLSSRKFLGRFSAKADAHQIYFLDLCAKDSGFHRLVAVNDSGRVQNFRRLMAALIFLTNSQFGAVQKSRGNPDLNQTHVDVDGNYNFIL